MAVLYLLDKKPSDNEKIECIRHHIPDNSVTYLAKQYKDSQRKWGFMSQSCRQDWLEKWSFLCYSKSWDGVFCLACVFFTNNCSCRGDKQLISEPYQVKKDLLESIKNHAFTEYHLNSIAQINEFMRPMNNPEKGFCVTTSQKNKKNLKKIEKFWRLLLNTWSFVVDRGLV